MKYLLVAEKVGIGTFLAFFLCAQSLATWEISLFPCCEKNFL